MNKSGPERAVRMCNKEAFTALLSIVSECCFRSDYSRAYDFLVRVINWNKSEFATQFLYFLCRNMDATIKPLIFDKAVIAGMQMFGLNNMCMDRLTFGWVAPGTWEAYSQYLILMHNWAGVIHCRPDQLVEFLRIRGMGGGAG